MSIKTRIQRLEAKIGANQEMVTIDLGDGDNVCIPRVELTEILREIDGAETGPGPSASGRRFASSLRQE